jgi:hypothetical protein
LLFHLKDSLWGNDLNEVAGLKEDAYAVLGAAFAGVPILQFGFPSFFCKQSVLSKKEATRQNQTLYCSVDP